MVAGLAAGLGSLGPRHNVLRRIEGPWEHDMVHGKFGQMGTDLGIRPAMLSVLLQVLFWSEVVAPGNLRTH